MLPGVPGRADCLALRDVIRRLEKARLVLGGRGVEKVTGGVTTQ